MATRITPTGNVFPFTCHLCGADVDGPDAEYVQADVVNERGQVVYSPKQAVRRHFPNATHAITTNMIGR